MPQYACEQRDKCGLAEHCNHGQPHDCFRCPDCGTWCDQSNGFCQGGLCTQPPRRLPAGAPPYKPSFPVRCVSVS